MDDPVIKTQTAHTRSVSDVPDLNSSMDPPGGEDLSAYRKTFTPASVKMAARALEELKKLDQKIQDLDEDSIEEEIETLIKSGMIDPAQLDGVLKSLKNFRDSNSSVQRAASAVDVKAKVRDALGAHMRKKGLGGIPTETIQHVTAQQKKPASLPSVHAVESMNPKEDIDSTGVPAAVPAFDYAKANKMVQEALDVVAHAQAIDNEEEKQERHQEQAEEDAVIEEIHREHGVYVDGNYRDINRDNKAHIVESLIKKK